MTRARIGVRLAAAAAAVLLSVPAVRVRAGADPLPSRLTGAQLWQLSAALSEDNGYFQSDNIVSNEHTLQYAIPALQKTTRRGGVYLGVAPDQNFTYMLAVDPRMAFIVDIRRGNMHEHLMFKALVEMSADRADFVSRLFTKKRPAGLDAKSTAGQIFDAYYDVRTDDAAAYAANLAAIKDRLVKTDGLPLPKEDLDGIEYVYYQFYWFGPAITYSSSQNRVSPNYPDYADLMVADDGQGTSRMCRSYLASEENFDRLKDLESRNLIVPVVGNFAGPKALRAVGQYVRDHGATISAFYVSNVEQYLFPPSGSGWRQFYENVATLPVDDSSVFIRSVSTRFGYEPRNPMLLGPDGRASALDPIAALVRDFQAGKIQSYSDVNSRSR